MSRHRSPWTIFRSGLAIVATVAFAMIAQGCADQSQGVGSAEDYRAQGQNYAYGYGPYDPYMIGYDPYWARWYPAPVYYYSHGDGDNDCDDGNCGSGNGGHGGQHKPPPGTGTTPSGIASHPMPLVGIPHVITAPAVASGRSGEPGNGGTFGRGGGFGRSGFGRGGFGRR